MKNGKAWLTAPRTIGATQLRRRKRATYDPDILVLWCLSIHLPLCIHMIVYRGDASSSFEVKQELRSRYGIPALFFASHIKLAQLYAIHASGNGNSGGFVYQAELPNDVFTHDFEGKVSYSFLFRNLIYQLHRASHKCVNIINVADVPSKDYAISTPSSVIVVFDFKYILNLKLIQKNVRFS
jgi:hypothetical protein